MSVNSATAALDSGFTAGVTGYTVLEVTVPSSFTTGAAGGQTTLLDTTFALAGGDFIDTLLSGNPVEPGLPNGSIITGFLDGTPNGNLSTAQSSSLVVNDLAVVPGPVVGAGLPGLIAGACGWLVMLKRRRRDRKSTRLNSSHSGESRMPSSA